MGLTHTSLPCSLSSGLCCCPLSICLCEPRSNYFDGVLAAVPPCCIVRIFSPECACQCPECACQCPEALLISFEGHAIITGKRALLNKPLLFLKVLAKAAISS